MAAERGPGAQLVCPLPLQCLSSVDLGEVPGQGQGEGGPSAPQMPRGDWATPSQVSRAQGLPKRNFHQLILIFLK